MAKKSSIARNEKRMKLVEKYSAKREELFAIINDSKAPIEEKIKARSALSALPRNANPVRVRNRCQVTGRPHGYIRHFGLSRIAFREMAHRGQLPGVKKASW